MVEPRNAYGTGDRRDILVEAIASPDVDSLQHDFAHRVALVIEVKGPWNRGLFEDQRTQLADRYLDEAASRIGIYVVGWFPLAHWTATAVTDGRRSRVSNMDRAD